MAARDGQDEEAGDAYALGRSSVEYERLRRQALLWEETTDRVLRKARVGPDMRCLDLGSGTGAVMEILGRLVGPSGTVTGMDADGALGREALEILRRQAGPALSRFEFKECDLTSQPALPGGPYDVVFARLLLIHLRDPVDMLRKMHAALAPGGVLVVQDYDSRTWELLPPFEDSDLPRDAFIALQRAAGKDPLIGTKLHRLIAEAGAGVLEGTDVASVMCFREPDGLNRMGTIALRHFLPAALRLGVVSEQRAERFFARFDALDASGAPPVMLFPILVSAWSRKR